MARIWNTVSGIFDAISWLALLVIIYVGLNHVVKLWGGWTMFAEGLKGWSTLITGLLAVGAAYLTVQQMRKSDELQKQLHKEALLNASYKERLAVKRLQSRLPEYCRRTAAAVQEMHDYMNHEIASGTQNWSPDKVVLTYNAVFTVWMTREHLIKFQSEPAALLFTPEIDEAIAHCMNYISFFLHGVEAAPDMHNMPRDLNLNRPPAYWSHNMLPLALPVAKTLNSLAEATEAWVSEYSQLQTDPV
jgi:hypothetical protein